jgi:hypothetical protein
MTGIENIQLRQSIEYKIKIDYEDKVEKILMTCKNTDLEKSIGRADCDGIISLTVNPYRAKVIMDHENELDESMCKPNPNN